jgi:AcrR family transcriptional regulator
VSEDSLTSILRHVPAPPRRAAALPAEERREALIAATLPLVLEHGMDVSTRLIAEAAGVAEGTIFRVFASKNDLVEAAMASAFDPSSLVEAITGIDPSLPLASRLVAAVELMQARGRRIAGLVHAFVAHRTLPDDERAWRIRASETRVVDALALLVLPDLDELRCSPQETGRRLRLVTLALSSPRLVDTDPLPPEEIVSMLLDGLRRVDRSPADPPSPAPATTPIGAPAC